MRDLKGRTALVTGAAGGTEKESGGLDLLVNNAGVFTRADVVETTLETGTGCGVNL